MADTGLLCASCIDNVQFSILNGDLSVNMGSILENVYAQELISKGFEVSLTGLLERQVFLKNFFLDSSGILPGK